MGSARFAQALSIFELAQPDLVGPTHFPTLGPNVHSKHNNFT